MSLLNLTTIRPATTKVVTIFEEDFTEPTLLIFRANKYWFELTGRNKSVSTRNTVYVNSDYSQQGAKALIEHIKAIAIAQEETFTQSQQDAIIGTKTLYIIYDGFENISLRPSKEIVTKEELKNQIPNAEVWVSYDITDMGLINLVDELLDWMG